MNLDNFCLIISTVTKCKDLWPMFFGQLDKFLPEIKKKYVLVDKTDYDFGDDYKKATYLWGWFNEPKKNPIECNKPKFDRMKSKDIHPEHYGQFTRKERRAITPADFANAFLKANP